MSNQHFHLGKEGTQEVKAEQYIEYISDIVKMDPNTTTYN